MLFITACSNRAVTSNRIDAEENVADFLNLPEKFILEDDGLTINSLDDMGKHYTGFGSDGRIYCLSKVNDIIWEDPSLCVNDPGNAFELSWFITSSKPLEVVAFSKDEMLEHSNEDGEDNAQTCVFSTFDEMEEEEEEYADENLIMISPKLQGGKFTTQGDIFSGAVYGQTIIKSTFKPDNSSPVDITFYNTWDLINLGYPEVPVQSVIAQFKGEEEKYPLFLKVFKVDNPSFKYFITAVLHNNCIHEPDDCIIDKLERHPQYTGIIDNDGKVFLISR